MHDRNGDPPYASALDAMRHWPETATAIGARRTDDESCVIGAPLGLDDLFGLVVRPQGRCAEAGNGVVAERVRTKRWLERWPQLRMIGLPAEHGASDAGPAASSPA